ncbi:hypothetical protein E2C01_040337 [Portunus trituberculatus]|uniref:Uncharacterized protein n=1 Tax=Portunus trituberculatus TaxID=210409 RepID=A0A5B7FQJ0_PORTR|nr:hypothetical protein [Portunus trituberculatus]
MFPRQEQNVATSNPTFGELLGAIAAQKRELVRKIEKTPQKLNNAEIAVTFNLQEDHDRPHGIADFDFIGTQPDDLSLKAS